MTPSAASLLYTAFRTSYRQCPHTCNVGPVTCSEQLASSQSVLAAFPSHLQRHTPIWQQCGMAQLAHHKLAVILCDTAPCFIQSTTAHTAEYVFRAPPHDTSQLTPLQTLKGNCTFKPTDRHIQESLFLASMYSHKATKRATQQGHCHLFSNYLSIIFPNLRFINFPFLLYLRYSVPTPLWCLNLRFIFIPN
jgi:hypothetical protein